MTARIRILDMRTPAEEGTEVNTTSRASEPWQRGLSPFHLGPCDLYSDFRSLTMENAWQFAKVYAVHADESGAPTESYWSWARRGWTNPRAIRYPMGRGAKPLHSWWNGGRLDYVSARKRIYVPLYAKAVLRSPSWDRLRALYEESQVLILRDFDGYDHRPLGMSLGDVLHDPTRRMGHAFVLAMLLTRDPALEGILG